MTVDRRRVAGRALRWGGALTAGVVLAVAGANAWLWTVSSGHRSSVADAPAAPVVIVPGAKVATDGTPMAYLRGRLDAAIELVRTGKAQRILVSGDASGVSGDEIASMTTYLTAHGIDAARIDADGSGESTRATCERAKQVYGIDRALIVTQYWHVPRAVALCRAAGIEADGVGAPCECRRTTLIRNNIREWLAAPKALLAL
ncbi:vancomycin high temperature exclusion protein [Nocardia sp. NPDC052566]|uniref:vancomycin high temperature exclusion protein n=1 Tax=Nocardia sp. NPDC052566 TaxID=3364330 RepID=UPI0037C7B4BB